MAERNESGAIAPLRGAHLGRQCNIRQRVTGGHIVGPDLQVIEQCQVFIFQVGQGWQRIGTQASLSQGL